jgi:hypothetical protein
MIVSMLMHKLEKSVIFCMVPIRAISVFPFVLWESAKSMMFLEVAFISLIEQTRVPLGKENGWLDRICLEFKTGNLLCSKIPLKDLRRKGFWNDSDRD